MNAPLTYLHTFTLRDEKDAVTLAHLPQMRCHTVSADAINTTPQKAARHFDRIRFENVSTHVLRHIRAAA